MAFPFRAWHVRQKLAVSLLFMAAIASVARPRHGVAEFAGAGAGPAFFLQTAAASPAQPAAASSAAQVIMKNVSFQPAQITVKPGETVEWKNADIFAHTVTADDGSFDSGLIQPGQSWKMTVEKAGTIAYHCTPHPNMKATLVAGGNTQSPPGKPAATGGLPGFNLPHSPQELHPILVNFTAALLPLAFLSDLLGRWLKRASLHNAAAWMVLYSAIITPLTGIAGWWWKSKVAAALPANVIAVHQWLGTSLVLILIGLAIWRWRIHKQNTAPGLAYLACAALSVLALIYQGSLGGLMVFGR
jgi:plastocyanin/uncharacterized membrane protein